MKRARSWYSAVLIIGFLLSIAFQSCMKDDEPYDYYAKFVKDTAQIDAYVKANSNGLQVVKDTFTGVVLVIHELGTGLPSGVVSNKIVADYEGRLFPDGKIFDQGTDVNFSRNGVIVGWTIAFGMLPAGSTADILIPSYWAYNDGAPGNVPANSALQFRVTFDGVAPTTTESTKAAQDDAAILDHLQTKNITAESDQGLYYVMTQTGSGPTPGIFDQVRVKYRLHRLAPDSALVNDYGEIKPHAGYAGRVTDFINGVKIALMKMNVGSKAILYVPSGLGFGPYPVPDPDRNVTTPLLPSNSNLIIELELMEIY
jgi:FKBP-type peptidyl-prolyl cis-trans isomerase FkpA